MKRANASHRWRFKRGSETSISEYESSTRSGRIVMARRDPQEDVDYLAKDVQNGCASLLHAEKIQATVSPCAQSNAKTP